MPDCWCSPHPHEQMQVTLLLHILHNAMFGCNGANVTPTAAARASPK